jgi:hypothetical protein
MELEIVTILKALELLCRVNLSVTLKPTTGYGPEPVPTTLTSDFLRSILILSKFYSAL